MTAEQTLALLVALLIAAFLVADYWQWRRRDSERRHHRMVQRNIWRATGRMS